MKGFIILIFLAALVIYVIYFVVTSTDFVKFPMVPAYLSPFGSLSSTSSSAAPAAPAPAAPAPASSAPRLPVYVAPPPQGLTERDLSSFYGRVRITSVVRPSFSFGSNSGGELAIRADSSLSAPVDLSGWRVRGNRYEAELKGSSYALFTEPVNQAALMLRPGDELIAYGARSTVENVQLNKCTGYLNEVYRPLPRFPEDCPRPSQRDLATLSGTCQNYILSLPSCALPSAERVNQLSIPSEASCRAFLDTLNYGGCFRSHSLDADFRTRGWRLWLGAALPFDPDHDRLLLVDRRGLVVSEYIY